MEMEKHSFSAANTFPLKLLLNPNIIGSCIDRKKVPCTHLQLNPENTCQLNCSFCSCSSRKILQRLSMSDINTVLQIGDNHGLESITITGGGEPTLYPKFDKMIELISLHEIEMGLVTNGLSLASERPSILSRFVWIRVSASDELDEQLSKIGRDLSDFFFSLKKAIEENPGVDWALSYVVGDKPNMELIKAMTDFANDHKMTHLRLVTDILNAFHLGGTMRMIKMTLEDKGIDDSKIIYQDRSRWRRGQNPCYISLLKPVIGADGYIYPCCGTQYALKDPSRDYERTMRMGTINHLDEIMEEQAFFDGSICYKCYYTDYNNAIGAMMKGLKHTRFV